MQLVPCNQPAGPLEPAPSTSLREGGQDEVWEGFWSLDDERYYTRRVATDGGEKWFRIADLGVAPRRRKEGTAVLAFPIGTRGERGVPGVIVGRYRGRSMLVGRRAPRPAGDSR